MGLTRFVAPAREHQRRFDEMAGQSSLVTLEQVVHALGGDVPDVVIRDANENHVATWSPATATINSVDETMILSQVGRGDPQAASSARWSSRHEPVRQGGRLRFGDLRTLAGPWRGDVIEFERTTGERYELHPGFILRGMDVVAWFEAPVPVDVAAWVVENM